MILIQKHLEAKLSCVIAERIIEENLPINMDIGKSLRGMTEVLFSFNPEDEHIYLDLINSILDIIYAL